MPKIQISSKSVAIDKTNAQMTAIVAGAAFVTIFCLFASKAVFSSMHYQMKVASAESTANKQLDINVGTFSELQQNYKKFDRASTNIIGGSSKSDATGNNDGTNSQLVLDALPVNYDYPQVASTLEKILHDKNVSITNITGTDDQLNQQQNAGSTNPQTVIMPFSFAVDRANYGSVTDVIKTLQSSIRPIQINTLAITGGGEKMTMRVDGQTYYQSPKLLQNDKQVVR